MSLSKTGTSWVSDAFASPSYSQLPSSTPDHEASNSKSDRFRILLVEDDFLVASDIEAGLQAAGFEIVGIAVNAAEALALAESSMPALAIMDIRLSGNRDGIDAALALFQAYGLRCIFATAHSDDEARRRADSAKPLGWLQKPYSVKSLIALIKQVQGQSASSTNS